MAEREAPPLEPADVLVWLRKRGVVAHHAALMPATPPGHRAVVVFLEATLGQHEDAELQVMKMRQVAHVEFSGHSKAIMFVIGK